MRRFLAAWGGLCLAGGIAAWWMRLPALAAAAFLLEGGAFLLLGFEDLRQRLEQRLPKPVLALLIAASGLVPYLVFSLSAGSFRWRSCGLLASLLAAAAFWWLCLPRKRVFDFAFLAAIAAVMLAKVLPLLYAAASLPRLEALGDASWRRTVILLLLMVRGSGAAGLGFLPRARDWKTGVLEYLFALPFVAGLALLLGFASFQPVLTPWWKGPLTFAGMLWYVALTEEFFFRGLLQRWLTEWRASAAQGLAAASIFFGLAHLWFGTFPNWKFALLATLTGVFYGRAYQRTGSIRAAMVTHALVNTTWRILFKTVSA